MDIEKIKEDFGYKGKPKQWQVGFDALLKHMPDYQERENAQLRAIMKALDKVIPLADDTCDEHGITFSEACRRQLIEDRHPLFV